MAEWHKAIPESRDRLQSKLLVWTVTPVLSLYCLLPLPFVLIGKQPRSAHFALLAYGLSLTFAILVWVLRAATMPASFAGATICFLVTFGSGREDRSPMISGLTPLLLLFVLTFAATRLGKSRKEAAGLAEGRGGRRASQIVANLGIAALVVLGAFFGLFDFARPGGIVGFSVYAMPAMLLAALAEATADTVSSEIGQAFGGRPVLLTTFQRVPAGTDGALTILGTCAGIVASGLVVLAGLWALRCSVWQAFFGFVGGLAGLFFDSLLGATVERKGWLGNDLVNFTSTAFAALVALVLAVLCGN